VTVRAETGSAQSADLTGPSGQWAVCVPAALDSIPLTLLAPSGEVRLRTIATPTRDLLVDVPFTVPASDFTFAVRPPEPEAAEPVEVLLEGVIYEENSDTPVPDARVVLRAADGTSVRVTESGAGGEFALSTPSNVYRFLTVEKIGYVDQTLAGNLRAGTDSTGSMNIFLRRAPIPLEGVEANVDRPDVTIAIRTRRLEERGFFDRQRAGFGDFFTPEMIAQRQPIYFSDHIIRLPGVNLDNGILQFRRRGGGQCEPNIWVDGALVVWGERDEWVNVLDRFKRIDNQVPVADVMGVEVYRTLAGTPVRYSIPNAQCGTVVIWTG